MLDRKGFLFTVTIFLILIYILLSVSVWVKAIEASERSFSEFFKESTVELTIEQITPEKMDNVTYIVMNRALTRLNDHTFANPADEGPPFDENMNVRGALFGLVVNGSADGEYFKGNVSIPPEENSSLTAWKDNLNASLRAIGIFVEDFEVTDFQVGQSDIDKLNYSMDISLTLKDYSNVSSVTRTYEIANEVDISGLVDPALARGSMDEAGDNQTIYRVFLFNKTLYPNASSISVSEIPQSVQGGQGWMYGQLALANGSAENVPNAYEIAPTDRDSYILVGTFREMMESVDSTARFMFGGYILTDGPTHPSNCSGNMNEENTFNPIEYTGPECEIGFGGAAGSHTDKPFIVAPGFDAEDAPDCPLLDQTGQTRKCVLMLNTYLAPEVQEDPARKLSTSGSGLYEIEEIRDFVMCGYYTHNPAAPSYMQRLLDDSYLRNSTDFGIETFVIGVYANDYDVYDLNSRLDRELFNGSVEGIKVRGLPGCRNFNTCADSPVTGIFTVSETVKDAYGLGEIACDNGAAGCEP
ncbi:MAG: hypothetical protein AB1324_06070 [Candidatus Micrarchaeota archaeon]